jgi:hypothetical protein
VNLSPEQVAAAEAAGCSFVPAPDHAIHRYTMQRKVFRAAGRAVLATRGGGLFETMATLERLIAQGRELLAARRPPAAEPTAGPVEAEAPPVPRSPRLRRTRPLPQPPAAAVPAEAPAPASQPPVARPERDEAAPIASARDIQGAPRPRSAQQPRTPRWLTAGAERRGRASVHWSTRLR